MNKNKSSSDFIEHFKKKDDVPRDLKPKNTHTPAASSIEKRNDNGKNILIVFLLFIITMGVGFGSWFLYDKLLEPSSSEITEQASITPSEELLPPPAPSPQNETMPSQVEQGAGVPKQNADVNSNEQNNVPVQVQVSEPESNSLESAKVVAPEDRKPLLLEGKKTLFQRVLTRPSAIIYSQIPGLSTPVQTSGEEYVLIDASKLNCVLEGFSSSHVTSSEKTNLATGKVGALVCGNKKVMLKSNGIEGGFLETVDYGKVKIQFNLSEQTSYLLWMEPKQIKALIEFVGVSKDEKIVEPKLRVNSTSTKPNFNVRKILIVIMIFIITMGVGSGSWFIYDKYSG